MNKNFKEKQRENILIKLIKKYEEKINKEDNHIKELKQKKKHKDNLIYGIKINNMYWLGVMVFNLVLFPIIGHYYIGSVIRGISMAIVSTVAIGTTLLMAKVVKNRITKVSNNLSNEIKEAKREKEDYHKDLDKLIKHIAPAHIEYDIKPNDSIETNHESYVNNYFMEDYSMQEEDETKEVEGPTLVKRKKKR